MQNENNVCSQFTLISKNQPINFQPITFVLTWVSKMIQLFFSIPMVMTFPSVCAINGSSKLKKRLYQAGISDSGSGRVFRVFQNFRASNSVQVSGVKITSSGLGVRICLSALSFCFFLILIFLFRNFNCNSLGYSNMFVAVKLSMVL